MPDLEDDDGAVYVTKDDEVMWQEPRSGERLKPPEGVIVVPQLKQDLKTLSKLLSASSPPWRFVRGKSIWSVCYGFGDASKNGFGASIDIGRKGVWYRFGTWGTKEEAESSNFRELNNLVETLEELSQKDSNELHGVELFLFMDNTAAEGAFYWGTSPSRKLFGLVVRLRLLEMNQCCIIHVIHVA
mmetsp:Transcript_20351/g.28604  ORF Transcript_20351/g.28604 Transcript_20351/m.28604 type:complete len:186 (+) Transcript_20351:5541-6098(+)